jgi:hypothetical protein
MLFEKWFHKNIFIITFIIILPLLLAFIFK